MPVSTSLTSTRSARSSQGAACGARSDPRVGAPLPPDVTLPTWCRGSRENNPPSSHPVGNPKPATATYHPHASRAARAFGEASSPLEHNERARSARVSVAAGFKAGASTGARPSTVDHRVSPARSPRTTPTTVESRLASDGPQLLITSVRTSKKAGAPRHTLSGSAAEASRRALAVKRTCSTSAATAAAALNHPHATLFDALKDHTALRAEWLAELEAARVLTEVERERANEAARATEAIRIELAMRRLEIENAQAARAAAAAGEARAFAAETEAASHRARVAELEAALDAYASGKEHEKQALRDAETKVRDAHSAATAAAASAARDRDAVVAERAETKRVRDALGDAHKVIAENEREVAFARQSVDEMADMRRAHARALGLLRAEKDTAKGRAQQAEAKTAEVASELAFAKDVAGTERRKASAALELSREETLMTKASAEAFLEGSRQETSATKAMLDTAEATMVELKNAVAAATAETDTWRFESESKGRALLILRGQHEAYVIATGGGPAPITPLLRRERRDDDRDGDVGDVNRNENGNREVGTAPPRRVSEGATPMQSLENTGDAIGAAAAEDDQA